MIAMLPNVFWLVAVSKCLECSLGILKETNNTVVTTEKDGGFCPNFTMSAMHEKQHFAELVLPQPGCACVPQQVSH